MDPYTTQILIGIGKGIIFGGIAAGIGYIKNETWETFDPWKFTRTLIIGAIVGGITGTGHSITDISVTIGNEFGVNPILVESFIMTAIVALADNIVKVIARRTDLGKLWETIKKFFGKRLSK